MRSAPRFAVGRVVIGKYKILGELGSGGMEAVVKAQS